MPCYKCSNGLWKYGLNGDCVHTLSKCRQIEAAIHAQENDSKKESDKEKDCPCKDEK